MAGVGRTVLFFGGNGHSAARLAAAQSVLREESEPVFQLLDAEYPGFDGRERVAQFDDFLDALTSRIAAIDEAAVLLHGTGIGGLLLLCLRSRGVALSTPLLLHAPVLWGLERRLMPKLLRLGPLRHLLRPIMASSVFQHRFVAKQFTEPLAPEAQRAFFDGYGRCSAAPDFFDWLTPSLLRELEQRFGARPEALDRVRVWWGERDRVVSVKELELSEQTLGVRWPLRTFPAWGHYPMIDQPRQWVAALAEELSLQETHR
jgi:pimeloyl-ACP methyl ester carboxylesterase